MHLFVYFICMTLHKMVDAIEDEHEVTFKFNKEVHNYPAVWDNSSVVYKETKNKQLHLLQPKKVNLTT